MVEKTIEYEGRQIKLKKEAGKFFSYFTWKDFNGLGGGYKWLEYKETDVKPEILKLFNEQL